MAEVNIDVAMQSTSEDILNKLGSIAVEKLCVPSGDVLQTLHSSEETTTSTSFVELGSFINNNITGTVRFTASLKNNTGGNYHTAFKVIKNNEETFSVSTANREYTTMTLDVSLKPLDRISFGIHNTYATASIAYCNLVAVCGEFIALTDEDYFTKA